jgi:hypothetical protein
MVQPSNGIASFSFGMARHGIGPEKQPILFNLKRRQPP